MNRSTGIDTGAAMLGAAGLVGGVVIAYLGLSFLARPQGASTRLTEISRQADEADRLRARLKGPSPYPAGSVCDGAESGVAALRQTLMTLAGQSNVTVVNFQAAPETPDEANGGLQPVRVSIDGNGASSAVIGLLRALSKSTPLLFVDQLNLRPADGLVSLNLSGRIFCSPVRP